MVSVCYGQCSRVVSYTRISDVSFDLGDMKALVHNGSFRRRRRSRTEQTLRDQASWASRASVEDTKLGEDRAADGNAL